LKLLVIFLLVALLLVFLSRRLRPYLKILRQILGFTRGFISGQPNPVKREFTGQRNRTEHLVRCAACGTWVPAARALINEGSEAVFCSSDCAQLGIREKPSRVSASK